MFPSVQSCLVPRFAQFSPDQKEESARLINRLLQKKSPVIRLKISVFLWVIKLVSLLIGQDRAFKFFFDSPIALFRKGFWGINTLAKYGVYSQPSLYPVIRYHKRPLL